MYQDTDSNISHQDTYITLHDSWHDNSVETYPTSTGGIPWTYDFNFHLNTSHSTPGIPTVSQWHDEPHPSPQCLFSRAFSRRDINSPQPIQGTSGLLGGLPDAPPSNSSVLTATSAHNVHRVADTGAAYMDDGPLPRSSQDGDENIFNAEPRHCRSNASDVLVHIPLAPSSPEKEELPDLCFLAWTRRDYRMVTGSQRAYRCTSTLTEITPSRRSSTAEVNVMLMYPQGPSPTPRAHSPPSPAGGDTAGRYLGVSRGKRRTSTSKSWRPRKKRAIDPDFNGGLHTGGVCGAAAYRTRSQTRRDLNQEPNAATRPLIRLAPNSITTRTPSKRKRSDMGPDEDEDEDDIDADIVADEGHVSDNSCVDNDSDYIPEISGEAIPSRSAKKRPPTRQTQRIPAPSSSRPRRQPRRGEKQTYYYRGTTKLPYSHSGDVKRFTISKCHGRVWCSFCDRTYSRVQDSPKRHLKSNCEMFKTSTYYQNLKSTGMKHEQIVQRAIEKDKKPSVALQCANSAAYKELLRENGCTHEEVLAVLRPRATIYKHGDCDCCPFHPISTYRKEPQYNAMTIGRIFCEHTLSHCHYLANFLHCWISGAALVQIATLIRVRIALSICFMWFGFARSHNILAESSLLVEFSWTSVDVSVTYVVEQMSGIRAQGVVYVWRASWMLARRITPLRRLIQNLLRE
ncbi:hypothetical protein GY45DRAFT_1336564 [Cubamyces sp. BRFM 1775]|nr:hypothetical protein GY45DRAFT_1336564 [Cubamyces sp. BRFM 1775]